MVKPTKNKSSKRQRSRDPLTVERFVEEVSWLLESYENLDFGAVPDVLFKVKNSKISNSGDFKNYVSPNPNIHYLVGVLPRMLNDSTIFGANEDIAKFSEQVLSVNVPRWEKKSKYEIIGHVVCNVYDLDDKDLSSLVKALEKIVSNEKRVASLIKKKQKSTLNWNQLIRQLSDEL